MVPKGKPDETQAPCGNVVRDLRLSESPILQIALIHGSENLHEFDSLLGYLSLLERAE